MEQNEIPLSRLRMGDRGRVTQIGTGEAMRRRLGDLGLLEGTAVECLHRSLWGDPAAYLIRGAVIALRNTEGDQIRIAPI
ncbi:MAG: FeoA family protein [Candidatus Merdivicinus sp.]|jgi:ferrous iron transport protein A